MTSEPISSEKGIALLNAPASQAFGVEALNNAAYKNAYNAFSYSFFRTVTVADGKGNVCLSPFSAYMAFSLCFAGSDGVTAEEFRNVFGLSKEQAAEYCRSLYAHFLQREIHDEKTKIDLANSVWISNADAPYVQESYLLDATNYFNAEIYRCDFFDPETVKAVNRWCSEKTDGLVPEIVDEFDDTQVMTLLNALLVEAAWSTPYTSYEVKKAPFTNKDASQTEAEYLCRRISSYYEAEDAKAFRIALSDGFSFMGILPDGDIDAYCASLTSEKMLSLMNNLRSGYDVNTRIPKFTTDYSVELIDRMKEMGLIAAFDGGAADFSKMIDIPGDNVYIGDARQKTHFEVDENGIKAAAVTYIGMEKNSMFMPRPTVDIYLDRPFVYLLMDNETGLPLFVGTVRTL